MRKLIVKMQMSLDGFITGPGDDMSWLDTDDNEQWQDIFQMLESVDLCLLGRVMWPGYRDYWKNTLTNPDASDNDLAYAKFAEKTKHIVFSKTIDDAGWDNSSISRGPVEEEVSKLIQSAGGDIYVVGGARLVATLMEAGLVDEYRLTIAPVIVGQGKSFFQQQHSKQLLESLGTKPLLSGTVIARYAVKEPD